MSAPSRFAFSTWRFRTGEVGELRDYAFLRRECLQVSSQVRGFIEAVQPRELRALMVPDEAFTPDVLRCLKLASPTLQMVFQVGVLDAERNVRSRRRAEVYTWPVQHYTIRLASHLRSTGQWQRLSAMLAPCSAWSLPNGFGGRCQVGSSGKAALIRCTAARL